MPCHSRPKRHNQDFHVTHTRRPRLHGPRISKFRSPHQSPGYRNSTPSLSQRTTHQLVTNPTEPCLRSTTARPRPRSLNMTTIFERARLVCWRVTCCERLLDRDMKFTLVTNLPQCKADCSDKCGKLACSVKRAKGRQREQRLLTILLASVSVELGRSSIRVKNQSRARLVGLGRLNRHVRRFFAVNEYLGYYGAEPANCSLSTSSYHFPSC